MVGGAFFWLICKNTALRKFPVIPMSRLSPTLSLLIPATVALAFKGVIVKLAYAEQMGVLAVLCLRFAFAAPLFWLGYWWLREPRQVPLQWRDWLSCTGAAVLFFLATLCDFTALSLTGVALSRIILFTYPALVVAADSVRRRRWPATRTWVGFLLAYGGLIPVMAPRGLEARSTADLLGALWAFGAAASYAGYLLLSQPIMQRTGSVRFTAVSGTVTLLIFLLYAPLTAGPGDFRVTASGTGWVALMAVACTVVPFFLLFEGIRRASAAEASLVTLAAPVVTVSGAYVFLGERLSPVQFLGFVLVMLGIGVIKDVAVLPRRWRPGKAGSQVR